MFTFFQSPYSSNLVSVCLSKRNKIVIISLALTAFSFVLFFLLSFIINGQVHSLDMVIISFIEIITFSAIIGSILLYNIKQPIIPDLLVLPGIISSLLFSLLLFDLCDFLDKIGGLLVLGGIFYLLAYLTYNSVTGRSIIGGGTIKLGALFGVFWGSKFTLVMLPVLLILLLPKFVIDIWVNYKNELSNTSPYFVVASVITYSVVQYNF